MRARDVEGGGGGGRRSADSSWEGGRQNHGWCMEHITPVFSPGRGRPPPPSLGPPWLTQQVRGPFAGGGAGTSPHEAEEKPPPQPHKPFPALPQVKDICPQPWDPGGAPSPLLVGQSVHTSSTVFVSPVDRSHTRAVVSPLPVASCRPSGLKATL